MSTGMKKSQLPSQSKKVKKPPEKLMVEYEAMVRLADEAERERGQNDTYWHTTRDRIAATLRDVYDMEV